MKKILQLIRTHLSLWTGFMQYPYSEVWDKTLLRLISEKDFTNRNDFYAEIGGVKVWVTNYPYASFLYSYNEKHSDSVRPSAKTIALAKVKLEKDTKDWKARAVIEQKISEKLKRDLCP